MTTTSFPNDTAGSDWAVFNAEGCISRTLSYDDAMREAAMELTFGDEGVYVDRECADHEEQPARTCEECATDGDEDEGED